MAGETPGDMLLRGSHMSPGDSPLRETNVIDLQVGLHVFLSVLILGTVWRVLQYHAMASSNSGIQHIGKAMSTQY